MNFAGRWSTSFGPMVLAQDGSRVRGTYGREGTEHPIEGTATANEFTFRYTEAQETGTGRFWLRRHGSFGGEYLAEGSQRALPWQGWRDCDGLWDTHLGRLRFVQETRGPRLRLRGVRCGGAHRRSVRRAGSSRSSSRPATSRAAVCSTSIPPATRSTANGWSRGNRRAQLGGQRILPRPGLVWLVVVEAYWQRALDDNEFAFGSMLKELFARLPRVQVRHRFYHDETSLLHWCRQLLFLPEPAVLMLAGHGEANGLTVNGKIIPPGRILESLRFADGLQLLHFSSCLVGQDSDRALIAAPFPVSGYKTSVDWAMSAFTEFIYLDMILEKGLSPAAAAEQLVSLVRFAGNDEIAGSPYRPAGFCFFGSPPDRAPGS